MISLASLKDKVYYVVGLARSGQAALQALEKAGVPVYGFDDSLPGGTLPEQVPWASVDAVILSPGIPHDLPAPHPAAVLALQHGVPIICDVDLLVQVCPEATYIAVTGTNGKSTTTALIQHLIPGSQMGGNIGLPVLDLEPFHSKRDIYILELSSYQLERIPHLKADVVVWSNITSDHLERHGDMAAYVGAKKKIFKPLGEPQTIVIGVDDPSSATVFEELSNDSSKKVLPVSIGKILAQGISVVDGQLYDNGQNIVDISSLRTLRGAHNYQNIALAYGALKALERPFDLQYLQNFPGLAHRQEVVRTLGQVTYVNDSKATNIESTLTALAAFQDVYLLAGGVAKESGLRGIDGYRSSIQHVYLYGASASAFAGELAQCVIPHSLFNTLEEALQAAHVQAHLSPKGGTVLLSPACASFDHYKDFEARGDAFRTQVHSLITQKGVHHG